ncbi:MAG TPA: hypothetical protein VF998_04535 [Candidatus Limnocylindria bacterium]
MSDAARLAAVSAALLLFRLGSAAMVFQPGYTDAYYYHDVAQRLASGKGLTADFVWNFIEAPGFAALPVASHRFWMPLSSLLQAAGIAALPFLDAFRAAQAVEILLAALIPAAGYVAARSLGANAATALVAAALAGLGGAFAPGWVSLDSFAPAALLGTAFFVLYARAARGDVRSGAGAGLAVGLLFLARAEGALFGLAFVPLVIGRRSRAAALAGAGAALAIGIAWLVRGASLGAAPDLVGRSAFLVRYEDFFAIASPAPAAFAAALPDALATKLAALATDLGTFLFAFGLLLVPGMARAAIVRRDRPDVGAFAALALGVYLAESAIFTLHATHGSYFHSLAAFFPFGVALGVIGTSDWLATIERRRLAAVAGVVAFAVVSAFAVIQWDAAFNPPYRERLAVLGRIPPGPFLAIDAAAWRWIADRPVIVTPADGIDAAVCAVALYKASAIVLERAHFSAYAELYDHGEAPPFFGDPIVAGDTKIYPVRPGGEIGCSVGP